MDKSWKAESGTASEQRESIVGYTVFPHVLQGLEHLFLWKTMQKQGAGPRDAVVMELPCWAWEAVECRAKTSLVLTAGEPQDPRLIPAELNMTTSWGHQECNPGSTALDCPSALVTSPAHQRGTGQMCWPLPLPWPCASYKLCIREGSTACACSFPTPNSLSLLSLYKQYLT